MSYTYYKRGRMYQGLFGVACVFMNNHGHARVTCIAWNEI